MKDWTSGEEVNYAYDELKRLASAVTVGPEWGNSYVYDGFGNLLQKNVVKGTAPYMNGSIDPATNKPYSGYSAAGLPTSGAGFDNDNRMISTTAGSSYQEYYAYSPAGKRVWNRGKRDIEGTWVDKEEVWFWGVTGQRMAFYALTASGNPVFTLTSTNLYMGSKLVMSGGAAVKTDRLGSVGKFYPWGEERTPTGASGQKFATYYHDVQAAMNYADQRWHGTNGRFQVPDPYQASAAEPKDWNRHTYVRGDPTNSSDSRGLYPGGCRDPWGEPIPCPPPDWNPENPYNPNDGPDVVSPPEGDEQESGDSYAWERLEKEIKGLLAIISDTWSPNGKCKEFLGTLGLGSSVVENLKKRTKLISFQNGLGSNDRLTVRKLDGTTETKPAHQWFQDPERHAMTPLGGTTIYWGTTYSDTTDLGKLAEVFHELLHTMSPTMGDELLAPALGVTIVKGNTSVITGALKKLCFE